VKGLPDGWLDGEGKAVTAPACRWAVRFLTACEERRIPFPRIFPTTAGGLLLEEQPHAVRWSLEVEPDGTTSICVAGGGARPFIADALDETQSADALGIFLAGHAVR
jgi:hypothetical protein